jgi:KUP system potassium uptake protein
VAALVVGFGSSARLASAYGVAVTGTMVITTILFFYVARTMSRTRLPLLVAGAAVFLTVDLALFGTSMTKIGHGAWVPLIVGLAAFTVLTTWRTGRELVLRTVVEQEGPLRGFVNEVRSLHPPAFRAPGTAVFLGADRETTPLALRDNLDHNHVVHRSVVIVVFESLRVPHVAPAERVSVDALGYRDDGITLVTARLGYRDTRDLPATLELAGQSQLERRVDSARASYFLSRITVVPATGPGMRRWRKRLFALMWRNAADPTAYFGLPERRTVTMGSLVEI